MKAATDPNPASLLSPVGMNATRTTGAYSKRVLITEGTGGQSRAAVAAVRGLAREGYEPIVTVTGDLRDCLAASSRFCAGRVPVPSVLERPAEYAAAVRAELETGDYVATLPASDAAILALGMPVERLLDKSMCAEAARAAGMPVPPTTIFETPEQVRDAADGLEYPVIVKPDVKRLMAARADSAEEFISAGLAVLNAGSRILVQPWLADTMRGIVGVMWQGRIVVAMHMSYRAIWPQPCGTVASAVTVEPDAELEQRLEEILQGYDGVFHADLAGPYLLDLNPRIHATLPLAIAAGANTVARYCDLLNGVDVPTHRARSGVYFRWIGGEVRNIIYRVRRGQLGWLDAMKQAAPRGGTVHSLESVTDPGPMFTQARNLVRRLGNGTPVGW